MESQHIKDILTSLLKELSIPFDGMTITEEEGYIRVDIASHEASRLIGWHGETLNALQHLVKVITRQKEATLPSSFIILDVDGYRRAQEERVKKMTEQKADFVRRTGNRLALVPMSPYFRRLVHLYVAGTPSLQDLTTESIGEGEYRQVVLRLKNQRTTPKDGEELAPILAKDDGLENLDI